MVFGLPEKRNSAHGPHSACPFRDHSHRAFVWVIAQQLLGPGMHMHMQLHLQVPHVLVL
jgi:hypothetical protein